MAEFGSRTDTELALHWVKGGRVNVLRYAKYIDACITVND